MVLGLVGDDLLVVLDGLKFSLSKSSLESIESIDKLEKGSSKFSVLRIKLFIS